MTNRLSREAYFTMAMKDLGALGLRLTVGGLLAGHGAQKLFGAFEGPGLKGTAGMMESLGLQPGHYWGAAAALSEFGGGVLTALGLFNPLGPIGIMSSMSMGTAKVHWGKPIWASSGGAELALTDLTAALAVALAGPGAYSLDEAWDIQIPAWMSVLAALTAAGAVAYGISSAPVPPPQTQDSAQDALGGTENVEGGQTAGA